MLLSSIEGAAITAVRIEGVAHEFSPIPGVVEDATDIILNLKQVPFKMTATGPGPSTCESISRARSLSGQIETDPTSKCSTATCTSPPSARAASSTSKCG